MTARDLTPADERQLAAAVKTAQDRMDAGDGPTAALAEAVRRHHLTPGRTDLVAAALNVGHTLAAQEAGEGCLEKMAGHPPADPRAATALATGGPPPATPAPGFPRRRQAVKTAGDPVGRPSPPTPGSGWEPPPAVKAAAAPVPIPRRRQPQPQPDGGWAARLLADEAAAEAAMTVVKQAQAAEARAVARAAEAQAAVDAYFRRPATGRVPAGSAVLAAAAYEAPAVLAAVKTAAERTGRAEPAVPLAGGRAAAAEVLGLARAAAAATHAAKTAAAATADAVKLAWGAVSTLAGLRDTALGVLPGTAPGAEDDRVRDVLFGLTAPDHTDELRRARARAMIHRFRTDPTDPISGKPLTEVLEAFNDLSRLAPQAVEQPALAGPAIRRALAGKQELFESKTLLDADKLLNDYPGYEDPVKGDKPAPAAPGGVK